MVNERLLKLMEQEKVTAARLAEILEVQPSAISHILSGRNKPSFDFMQKLAFKFPRLNVDWLLTGKGNMYKVAVQQSLFYSPSTVKPKEDTFTPKINEKKDDTQRVVKFTDVNISVSAKSVKQIVFIYSDNTFEIYSPSKSD
ncbi:MAG TPA: XRE family transcriptional regulator [Bacteroidales bacterium]|nr:XRE family transcriptional regulator [Bacteroidales bacterium]